MQDLRRLFPFIRPYLPLLSLSLVLLVASGLLEGAIVIMLEPIFNLWTGSDQASQGVFGGIVSWMGLDEGSYLKIPALLILFSIVKGACLYSADVGMSLAGQKVVAELRRRLHLKLLEQSTSFYARHSSGQLMARVITDSERIQQTVSKTLTDFARQCILLLTFLAILLSIDWLLTLAAFVLAPPVLWITLQMGRRLRGVASRSQQNLADISESLQETIAGQRIVKAFGMERYEQSRFESMLSRLVGNNMKAARIGALNSPTMEALGYIAFAPLLIYANYQIQRDLTLGSVATFIVALFRLYDPIRKLSRMHLHFQQAFASSGRIFELLDSPVDLQQAPDAPDLPPFRKEIRFEGVSLRYEEEAEPALQGIDLTIRQGEMVALVGASGAGKSSLANLLPRFYDPSHGRILIDGTDLRSVALHSLRSQVALVAQETFLFNDTLQANIAYGRLDRPLDEVVEAARAAYIHDFISGLPEGYGTLVGERGQKLSGGQRQRIAIARALLKNAPILILDEATSALDSESERLVQKALYNLTSNSTAVVIAHRLSTVRQADRIVVLDKGRIVEIGGHQELMETSGLYRRLYELQFEE